MFTKRIKGFIAALVLFGIFSFSSPSLASASYSPLWPSVITSITNQIRLARDLPTLHVNPLLNKAAQMKAQNMARYGYFAHVSPYGKTPWYWLAKAGYHYEYAGENLAVSFNTSTALASAWMRSPAHLANILGQHYTEVGTGTAVGYLNGKKVVFVAQVYANPA